MTRSSRASSLFAFALVLSGCGADGGSTSTGAPAVQSPAPSAPIAVAPIGAPLCVTSAPPAVMDVAACATAGDALDDALAKIALSRCTLGLDHADLAMSALDVDDARILPIVAPLQRSPALLPGYGKRIADALHADAKSGTPVAQTIATLSGESGRPIDACVTQDDLAPPSGARPLEVAIDALLDPHGTETTQTVHAKLSSAPLALQKALAPIVRAIAAARDEVRAARGGGVAGVVDPALLPSLAMVPEWILGVRRFELSSGLVAAFDRVDTARIAAAAARVALVIERSNVKSLAGTSIASVDLHTSIGTISLRGPGADAFVANDDDAPALLVDTGGDDDYRGPIGASSITREVSIAIDLGGADRYGYAIAHVEGDDSGKRLPSDGNGRAADGRTLSTTPRQGAGVLGVGLLFDYGKSNDTYVSLVGSQGSAAFGVGVLADDGGDDTYAAEGFSQGAAAWGIGALVDLGGADSYVLYNSGQGFGFTRGAGAIVELGGDDRYDANSGESSLGGDILYPSDQLTGPPQSPVTGNHSMAQGCGAGHRPDGPDPGYPFPGGLGVLADASGNDRYSAGVFAQGTGFVQGIGMLLEGGGDDSYDALYWAQGAAAHMSIALFSDASGADRYDATYPLQLSSLGMGHDFSIAMHWDASGNDTYRAPALALGCGEANGIGVFVNNGGTDSIVASSNAGLGAALAGDELTGTRSRVPTTGIFVKADGSATYAIGGETKKQSNATWSFAPDASDGYSIERSVGVDRPKARVAFSDLSR